MKLPEGEDHYARKQVKKLKASVVHDLQLLVEQGETYQKACVNLALGMTTLNKTMESHMDKLDLLEQRLEVLEKTCL